MRKADGNCAKNLRRKKRAIPHLHSRRGNLGVQDTTHISNPSLRRREMRIPRPGGKTTTTRKGIEEEGRCSMDRIWYLSKNEEEKKGKDFDAHNADAAEKTLACDKRGLELVEGTGELCWRMALSGAIRLDWLIGGVSFTK